MTDTMTQPARPGQGFAITSLVLGCCSIILFWLWVPPILAIIFGAIAISQARKNGHKPSGMAVAGLVLGIIFCALLALIVTLAATS